MPALGPLPAVPAPPIPRAVLPAIIAAADPQAQRHFLEFFAATIRNPHTRRAYARGVSDFLDWCAQRGVTALPQIQPLHVAGWIEELGREVAVPTVKARLAGIRHLFDWLVRCQQVPANPAVSVRGPAYSVRRGKTPVLDPAEARQLLDAIDVSTCSGLRDRALIGLMVYSFARVGAALAMRVDDVFVQNRRLWMRLHEKGGKRHEMPWQHDLEDYLHAYIDGCDLAGDRESPLFPTVGSRIGRYRFAPGQRLSDCAPARGRGRQSLVPRYGHDRLSQEWRHAGTGCGDGQPCLDPYYAALRSLLKRGDVGRGRARDDLTY